MPAQWVPLDERGRFASPPQVPAKYLPESQRTTRHGAHNERPPADPFGGVHGDGSQRGSAPSNGSQGDSAPRSRASNTRVIRMANGQRPR